MILHYTSNYVVLLLHSRLYQGRTGHTQGTNIIKINTLYTCMLLCTNV